MKKTLCTIAFMILGTLPTVGCQTLNPDQERIRETLYWTRAQVQTTPSPDPEPTTVRIATGDFTVLMFNEGYSRGKRSTAHASHHAVFMTLPSDIRAGQTYQVSRAADTLHYDAFAGHNCWYLDPDKTAWAKVSIESLKPDSIVAEVQIEVTGVCGSESVPDSDRPRYPISRKGTMAFKRVDTPLTGTRP